MLESKPAVAIGRMSYSLYLTHVVVIAVVLRWIGQLAPAGALSALEKYVLTSAICVPAALLVAFVFYLVAERPFLRPLPGPPAIAAVVRVRLYRGART